MGHHGIIIITPEQVEEARRIGAACDPRDFTVNGYLWGVRGPLMKFDRPLPCPFLPSVRLDGIAVDLAGAVHVAIDLDGVRVMLGPDEATVARRASVAVAALRDGAASLPELLAVAVGGWLIMAWEESVAVVSEREASADLD